MKFSNQLALILSLIGVLLFGLCLVAGLGLHDSTTSYALAMTAVCFLMGAFVAFWYAGEEEK
jgi:peptidoglycan/LPS O-acetylase OafA/YrhL